MSVSNQQTPALHAGVIFPITGNKFHYTGTSNYAKKRALIAYVKFMQPTEPAIPAFTEELYDNIADQLVEQGYAIIRRGFDPSLLMQLNQRVQGLDDGDFQQAGIGRGDDNQLNETIRTDSIRWLTNSNGAECQFLQCMEGLRIALNRRLFMGLFDYECHFAHYAPGDFYKRHLDAFRGRTNRVLSAVLYLNHEWQDDDGGELLMYERKQKQPLLSLRPEYGTMIIFLSERFPHEVLAAKRDRYSIAGWFRVNNSLGDVIDPAR